VVREYEPNDLEAVVSLFQRSVHEIASGDFARIDATGCLDLLYVHPEVQRQGVARALFDRVTSWAVSRGICHLHSEVSITARPFFESVGFRVVREQIVERGGLSLQNFRMKKDLDVEPLG
jgi:putative acetyltransferase